MIYYSFAFCIYYIGLIFCIRKKVIRCGLVMMFSSFPILLLVFLRGDVGTDTLAYLNIISVIKDNGYVDMELGFISIVKLMLGCGFNPRLIILAIALITTLILVYAGTLSKQALTVLMFCIVPVFYLDMTMNGLRYGLSFALASVAVAYFYKGKWFVVMFLALSSVSVHVSSLVIFGIMLLLANDRKEFTSWLGILIFLSIFTVAQYSLGDLLFGKGYDIMYKYSAYSNFKSPSIFSGIAPLIMSLATLFLIKSLKPDQLDHGGRFTRKLCILFFLIASTFLLAKFSYAGLRLQLAVLFGIFIATQFKTSFIDNSNIKLERKFSRGMFGVGILGLIFSLKNIYLSSGNEGSPWLPYSINPDLIDLIL